MMMSPTHPVTIVLASPPLLKPKAIRPAVDTASATWPYGRGGGQSMGLQRPGVLRASTLDGRSLSEVIDAAHRASMIEQAKYSYSPQSIDSRRMSFDSCPTPYYESTVPTPSRSGSMSIYGPMDMR